MPHRLKAVFMLAALFVSSAISAQTIGNNGPATQNENYTFKASSQLVVENVVVKDKKGNFIEGLSAKDFTITEDDAPQTIKFFEHQQLPTTPTPLPVTPSDEEQITIYKKLSRTQIAPEDPGSFKYKNHRLLALYFDMTAMPPNDQMRALAAAEKFVRTQMTADDLISIMRFNGGSVDVLQDFTADRNRLLSILQTLVVGEGQGSLESISDAASADTGAAFGQDDSEFNIFNTDRQLSALQTAAKELGQTSEKKVLIYFASGLLLHGVDNQAQLHATIDAAVRAGISFWTIDARGLVAQAPLGDATQGSQGNINMYSGAAAQAVNDRMEQSQDTMYALAADTGGKALLDNNDLTRGIVEAQRAISDYYLIGYYTTNSAQNGRFRKVKITVNPELNAALDYRHGYYANKEFSKFTAVDKERQLEDALMLGDPITDLTIAMEIDYFQLNRAEYFVPFVVKIPGRELALAKRFGAEHTLIDFVCEIKDEATGVTVTNLRDNVNIKLSDATAAELAHRPVEYDSGITLFPGRYSIKFLARDDETGRIGTYQTSFAIPNLNKVTKLIPISSVVLSSQRVDLKDALYNAEHGKEAMKNIAANPLVEDGRKMIPSVTRVFSTQRQLYVYLQAYRGATTTTSMVNTSTTAMATQTSEISTKPTFASAKSGSRLTPSSTTSRPTDNLSHPLIAFVGLYRNQQKAFETAVKAMTSPSVTRLGTVPISFKIDLAGISPGEYQCQVSILDPESHQVAFWDGPLALVP